jgi:hypothetical protein
MSSTGSDNRGERYVSLSGRLALVPTVAKLRSQSEEEHATLAHALLDIERLCRRLREELLPRLSDEEQSSQQMQDTLTEIGEVFREFMYHVRDPLYFRYLPGCEGGNE